MKIEKDPLSNEYYNENRERSIINETQPTLTRYR